MGAHHAYADSAVNLREFKSHLERQLLALQTGLLDDPTYPIPDDHPLMAAVVALPTLAAGVESVAAQLDAQSMRSQAAGSKLMGQVAAMDEARESRWRPPLRAWGMLAAAMTIATTVATLFASYAIRAGW